jgi:hypothetical protein
MKKLLVMLLVVMVVGAIAWLKRDDLLLAVIKVKGNKISSLIKVYLSEITRQPLFES